MEYHGGNKANEVTIIPIEFEINFLAGFRKGIGSRNGHTQEFGGKWRHPFGIVMKPCQKVKAKNRIIGSDSNFIDGICSDAFRQLTNYVTLMKSDLIKEKFNQR